MTDEANIVFTSEEFGRFRRLCNELACEAKKVCADRSIIYGGVAWNFRSALSEVLVNSVLQRTEK